MGVKKQTRDSYTWSTRDFRDIGEKSHEKLSTSGPRNSFNLKGGKGAKKRDKEWVKWRREGDFGGEVKFTLFLKARHTGNNPRHSFLDELKEEKGLNFPSPNWYKVKHTSNRKKGSDEHRETSIP